MKENIMEIFNTLGNHFLKRTIPQNLPQIKTSDKTDEFFNKLGFSWLSCCAKGFYLNSKQIKILNDPNAFYNVIIDKIKSSNNRIVLASLYLGTGLLERNIVTALNERLLEKPKLIIKILLDCIRGSRGEVNSRTMLLPLLQNHKDSCKVSLFQTPVLREPFLTLIPERYKEIIGLQHIKVYLFDNDLIISGANLSQDYFTNRQDRYILIQESKELADFIDGLVDKVSECSFQLDSKNELHLHHSWKHHPVKSKAQLFISEAHSRLSNYYMEFVSNKKEEFDTVIFPLIEMGTFNIHMDSLITTKILEECCEKQNVFLTTGYFNLTNFYIDSIINKSKATFEVLMAHPTANGFYNAKGPAKGIPYAYTDLASQFLNQIICAKQDSRIKMYEYVRPGWTYHAKGLWITAPCQELPIITMVGSPNFGERSVKRDLECQFLIVTANEELQRGLLREKEMLFASSQNFTETVTKEDDRVAPLWVKVVVLLFRNFL